MNIKIKIPIETVLIVFFTVCVAISAIAEHITSSTIDNLNKAYNGEANASHKYELFGKKADKEGFKQVGKLFRAVSMAEAVHENNHKAVILELGGKPDVINYDIVKIKSTKENLMVPLKGEANEKNVMYPKFIKQATEEKLPNAVSSFAYAQYAEAQHEKLFQDALSKLGKKTPVSYCVSRITGATSAIKVGSACQKSKCGFDNEYILVK